MAFNNSSIEGKIFFVSYGGGHAAALLPLIVELNSRKMDVTALALTTAKFYFANRGVSTLSMLDVAEKVNGYSGARRVGQVLAREQKNHFSVAQEETESYLGVGFHSLVRTLGLQQARKIYADGGRQRFCPVDFFRSWFMQERPAVVVATSAPRSEKAALEAARDLGIPSVCIVDLYPKYEVEWCASKDFASKICVLNEVVAKRFLDRGVPAERLVVTGNPAFDRLYSLDVDKIRRDTRALFGLKDGEFLLSWMSQPEPERHPFSGSLGDPHLPSRIEGFLFDGLNQRSLMNLAFRRHPSEDRARNLFGSRLHYSDGRESLDGLLCASDCVLTCSSTVGLEAAFIGVPVIQIMDSIFSSDLPLAQLGFAREVSNYKMLWPIIDEEIVNTSQYSRAPNMQKRLPLACGKISDLIQQLI